MSHHAAAVVTVTLLAARDAVRRRLADERGQGTVEYVGLILLVAGVLAAVVVWGRQFSGDELGEKITKELGNAIDTPGKGKP
jgi:hypothetical protein